MEVPKCNQICALTGVLLGLFTMVTTQSLTKDMFEPIIEACSLSNGSGPSHDIHENIIDENTNTYKLHPYEPLVGGTFVCLITQFLHELIQHSGGIFTWGMIAALSIVTALLMNVEADRLNGTRSIIRYPTILGILSQVLGISVVFPLLWVPGYCLSHSSFPNRGGGVEGNAMALLPVVSSASSRGVKAIINRTDGIPGKSRIYGALVTALLFPALTVLVFSLDPDSYAWTFTAGLLGGPLVACSPLLLWYTMPNSSITKQKPGMATNSYESKEINSHSIHLDDHHHKAEISKALSSAYSIAGIIAFIGYIINLRLLIKVHGFDLSLIWDELWTSADPTVAFMTIDVGVLFLGILLYISVQKEGYNGALKAVILMPFIGPGSACALVLSEQERRRAINLEGEKDL